MARGIRDFLKGKAPTNGKADARLILGTDPGSEEMRLHLRAHRLWRSLLRGRTYPVIEDLDPVDFAEFEPKSVLLDFTRGLGAPMIARLGSELREECGLDPTITHIAEVPSESLLACLTDQYPAILAHRAPVEVKAEFFAAGGCKTLFRGLLLPFSADGATIDYIYGVTSWQQSPEKDLETLLAAPVEKKSRPPVPPLPPVRLGLPDEHTPKLGPANNAWKDPFATADAADGPGEDPSESRPRLDGARGEDVQSGADISNQDANGSLDGSADASGETLHESADTAAGSPSGEASARAGTEVVPDERASTSTDGPPAVAVRADGHNVTLIVAGELADESDVAARPSTTGLDERLLLARQSAAAACESDVRSRATLYQALARAYDFAIAAEADKAGYAALLAQAGVRAQARAPMTPATKLVFGTHYDKKRLSEFAAVLSHARRCEVPQGGLDAFLEVAAGGIKGIVAAERALRRPTTRPDVSDQITEQMRHRWPLAQIALPAGEGEFVLLLARVAESNLLNIIARIDDDAALIQCVGRKVLAQETKAGFTDSAQA